MPLGSLLMEDEDLSESRKAAGSGINKHVLDRVLSHERYLACLNGQENGAVRQRTFKSKGHQIYTIETERNAGSCYDDKRYFYEDKSRSSLAHGHYSLR